MIINEQDFLSKLYIIQSQIPPSYILFPGVKKYYNIDLDNRIVEAPEHLSVFKDHRSETVYFKIPRFHDYMDLANTTCVIQYNTPDKISHLYRVPFYDIVTESATNSMIFPWNVDQTVTQYAGIVEFTIRFFIADREIIKEEIKIDETTGEEIKDIQVKYNLLYNLTTIPATAQVLEGMEVNEEHLKSEYDFPAENYETLFSEINKIKNERAGTYWIIET